MIELFCPKCKKGKLQSIVLSESGDFTIFCLSCSFRVFSDGGKATINMYSKEEK